MWELTLLVLEKLVYTNPFRPEKVDEHLPDGQPTPRNNSQDLNPYQNLKSCNYRQLHVIFWYKVPRAGWNNPVGIATHYWLDGLRTVSRWGQDFPHSSRPALGPPSLLHNGYRVLPGCKTAATWHWSPIPSSAQVKERVELYLYFPIWAFVAC